ncbi:MAG TPA: hypothetical protein VKY92_19885, partial [Verrucomicrobiae bacterium]|nr:hypothetical protein [Verrucomicrobiae bacterium]
MKYIIVVVFAAGLVAGSAYYINKSKAGRAQEVKAAVRQTEISTPQEEAQPRRLTAGTQNPSISHSRADSAADSAPARPMVPLSKSDVAEAVDVLVSPSASYEQKQASWKALRDRGGLDQAMTELQMRVAANPSNAEYAAVLGHACLQKCGTISDVRDQGILA